MPTKRERNGTPSQVDLLRFTCVNMRRRGGLRQKVLMAILSNEAFPQNFKFLRSAILRPSKFHISAKNYLIDLKVAPYES